MIVKNRQQVIHESHALEDYLDRYFTSTGTTFEQWVERFRDGFYRERNDLILELAQPLAPKAVLEFACAGPFLAELLAARISTIERYTCSNFSERMVEYCSAALRDLENCDTAVIDADVHRSPDMRRDRLAGYDLFVTTSLEHIEFDRELIDEMPLGSNFLFSVATFDDPEHFFVFESPDDVSQRYAGLLRITSVRATSDGNKYVVSSERVRQTRVSVIMPFHNPGSHFRQMLTSLVNQELAEPAEIVAVDNLSTDDSVAVATSCVGRIPLRVVAATEKANASYARNVGARTATGDRLFFVDADDELAPGYLAAMNAALDSHQFVTSRVDSASLNPGWLQGAHGSPWEGVFTYFDFMPAGGVNVGVFRRWFDGVGGFPEDFAASQDVVFAWRVQLAGAPLHFVPEAVYRYRYRDSLAGLFRQSRNWGRSNVLLYRTFKAQGMPGRSLRTALREWVAVLVGLLTSRSKTDAAPFVVRLGYCVGRLGGSLRFRQVFF